MVCREGEPAVGILAGEYQFEFIRLFQHDGAERLPVFLGTEGHPVDPFRQGTGPVGLQVEEEAGLVKSPDESLVDLQGGFSARDDHVPAFSGQARYFGEHMVEGHGYGTAEIRVAERTAQVAARQADENGRRPGPPSFSLEGIEDFIDAQRLSLHPVHRWPCCSRIPRSRLCSSSLHGRRSTGRCFRPWD